MARKNRVSIPDGTYHITSHIVNRQMWFKDPKLKDEIVGWLYGVAAFSGVELLSWCIMDNHFHILVHVPEVPEQYRLDPDDPPASHAFGMRPPECNPALWSPADGVCPQTAARPEAVGRGKGRIGTVPNRRRVPPRVSCSPTRRCLCAWAISTAILGASDLCAQCGPRCARTAMARPSTP